MGLSIRKKKTALGAAVKCREIRLKTADRGVPCLSEQFSDRNIA
jgi:hypothetical protein